MKVKINGDIEFEAERIDINGSKFEFNYHNNETEILNRLHNILEGLSIWRQKNNNSDTFESEEADLCFILDALGD